MVLQAQLQEFQKQFPLPDTWRLDETFAEETRIDALRIPVLGLIARNSSGGEAIASSAGRGENLAIRAYFELIERVSILEFEKKFGTFAENGGAQTWIFSKSNGVAAHVDLSRARANAENELIERDQVLRSWYSRVPPQRIPDSKLASYEATSLLKPYYHLSAYKWTSPNREGLEIHVVLIVGFPRASEFPLLFGLGSKPDEEHALHHAFEECWQRLGFLWGEDWSQPLMDFEPSGDFHQEYFLRPEGIHVMKKWLEGKGEISRYELRRGSPRAVGFVDLTPSDLKDRIHVVKAISEARVPLCFGLGNPFMPSDAPQELLLHPIP